MTYRDRNEIVIRGGNHGAVAAGTNAHAATGTNQDQELDRAVRRIRAAIEAVPEALPDPDDALRDVNAISTALEHGDHPAVRAAARRLLERVDAAGAYVTAAAKLRDAL